MTATALDLTVKSAEYVTATAAEWPDAPFLGSALHIVLAGGEDIYIDWEQKLAYAGWVWMGSDLEDKLGPDTITLPDGESVTVSGYSNDPTIVALTRRFLADKQKSDFTAGPVAVPQP